MNEVRVDHLPRYQKAFVVLKQEGEDSWSLSVISGRIIMAKRELDYLAEVVEAYNRGK